MDKFVVSFPGLGINDLEISRVAFSLFGIDVYWYGIIITTGIMLCLYLAYRHAPKYDIDQEFLLDNFIMIIIASLLGARAYYIIFSWDQFKGDFWKIIDFRQGGMAFYGGVIGAVIAILIIHAIKKKPALKFIDFCAVYLPLGQAIGRWGNFVNQEAFGVNTDLPWGMFSNGTKAYLEMNPQLGQNPALPVHPTFLYEFLGNMILFAVLLIYRRKNKHNGDLLATYLIGYGIIRYIVEGLRTDSLYVGQTTVRVSQILSLLMVVAGIGIFVYHYFMDKRASEILMEEKIDAASQDVKELKED